MIWATLKGRPVKIVPSRCLTFAFGRPAKLIHRRAEQDPLQEVQAFLAEQRRSFIFGSVLIAVVLLDVISLVLTLAVQ